MNWLKPVLPLTNIITNGMLSADTLTLLAQGACTPTTDFAALLGRDPMAIADFIRLA